MFQLEHYFSSRSFDEVREKFSSETGNKISEHRNFLYVAIAHKVTKQLKLRPY